MSRSPILARTALASFLLTFLSARTLVLLIMTRRMPDLYLHLGGTHVHHLNYGITLLAVVGGYLLLANPHGRQRSAAAALYGVALALTFDEFGMWLHLGGPYWQRASFDAVVVIAALLGLVAFAPSLSHFGSRHWLVTTALAVGLIAFGWLLVDSLSRFARHVAPSLHRIEQAAPD